MKETSYTNMRKNLASFLTDIEKGEKIKITRKGHDTVVIGKWDEGNSLQKREEKFKEALYYVQRHHKKSIKALADK